VRIAAPRDEDTLRLALNQAIAVKDGPTVVRFPKGELPPPFPALENRGEVDILWKSPLPSVEELAGEPDSAAPPASAVELVETIGALKPREPFKVLVVGYGAMIPGALSAAEKLLEDDSSLAVDVVTTTWVWPVSNDLIEMCREYDLVVTVEDGLAAGGIGSGLEESAAALDIVTPHVNLGVPTKFLPHATRDQVFRNLQLDSEAIASQVLQHVKKFKV
jgi:1-deoxy-D-xylulose-5-phosphate synthase